MTAAKLTKMAAPSVDLNDTTSQNVRESTENRSVKRSEVDLWRALLHPTLLISFAAIVLLFVLSALLLPQLPDQLHNEPAASTRWMMTAAADYGVIGPLLRGLGLFDVFHSALLRMSLAGLTLILTAHFVDALSAAIDYRRYQRDFSSDASLGEDISNTTYRHALFRRRLSVSETPDAVRTQVKELLNSTFHRVRELHGERQPAAMADDVDEKAAPSPTVHESQLLADRHGASFYLRPILPLGLLCATAALWLFLIVGWKLHTPTIAPGDSYRVPARGLVVSYEAPSGAQDDAGSANVVIQLDSQTVTWTLPSGSDTRIGASTIAVNPSTPGLLIRTTNGEEALLAPGDVNAAASAGLALPSPGSEESLLIPDSALGLRILRRSDDPATFIVEFYSGDDLLPQQRIEIDSPTTAVAGSGADSLQLELTPLPGVEITVQHMPGIWLLWIALVLALTGAYGFIRPPASIMTQFESWPVDRSLLTVVATRRDDLEAVFQMNANLTEKPTPDKEAGSLR